MSIWKFNRDRHAAVHLMENLWLVKIPSGAKGPVFLNSGAVLEGIFDRERGVHRLSRKVHPGGRRPRFRLDEVSE